MPTPNSGKRSAPRRVLSASAIAAALVYVTLICLPQIAFAHAVTYKNFRVYTVEPLGSDTLALYPLLDEVDRRLSVSEVYDRGVVHRVFLSPSHRWFTFFAPRSRNAFAINRRVLHNVVVNESDLTANVVRSGSEHNNRRSLDGVLAHELTHTLLAREFGELRLIQADATGRGMRQEGYCDYVAAETSFDAERGAALLRRGEREDSPSFEYFRWATAVRYLVETKDASVEDVLFGSWDIEQVLAQANPRSQAGTER